MNRNHLILVLIVLSAICAVGFGDGIEANRSRDPRAVYLDGSRVIPSGAISLFLTQLGLASQTLTDASFTAMLSQAQGSASYLLQSSATSTYLTQAGATTTYLTQAIATTSFAATAGANIASDAFMGNLYTTAASKTAALDPAGRTGTLATYTIDDYATSTPGGKLHVNPANADEVGVCIQRGGTNGNTMKLSGNGAISVDSGNTFVIKTGNPPVTSAYVDASKNMTVLGNFTMASGAKIIAYQTAGQTVENAATSVVCSCSSELTDPTNEYSNSSATVLITGYYFYSYSLLGPNVSTGYSQIDLYVDDAVWESPRGLCISINSTTQDVLRSQGIIHLNAGQKIDFRIFQNAGSQQTVTATGFTLYFLSK